MADATKAKYALYANSFGADRVFLPMTKDDNHREKYSKIKEVITTLEEEVEKGNVHFISEEFRAKALSTLIQRSRLDVTDYEALRKLRALPVARTENELKRLKKDRDEFVENNPRAARALDQYIGQWSIPDVMREAQRNKFEDRSDYVEKALALVTAQKRRRGITEKAAAVSALYTKGKKDSKEFKDDMDVITAEYASEGYEYPEPLKQYRAALEEEEIPVATSAPSVASDAPSVPEAVQVDDGEGGDDEDVAPRPVASLVEDSVKKAQAFLKTGRDSRDVKKAREAIRDSTALWDTPGIIRITAGPGYEEVPDVWKLVRTILREELKVSSAFLKKVEDVYDELSPEEKARHKADYESLIELPVDDAYFFKEADEVRAAFYLDSKDPQILQDEILNESMPGFVEPQEEEPDEPGEPGEPPALVEAPKEEPPVIEVQETDEERRREIEAANRDLIDGLTAEQRARLFAAPVRVLENWVAARRYAIEAQVQGNVDHDEADNGADDGFFGLRNNYINAILLSQQYYFQDFIRIRDLLRGQPAAVYAAALERIRARPDQAFAFDQQFLNEVLQQQNDAGNLVEATDAPAADAPAPQVDDEAYAGLGALFYEYPRPPDPGPVAEPKPSVSGSQPIVGTGSDSEKLQYRPRVHPDVIEIFFGQSSYPEWDPDLEKKLMSMELSEARRIEIMEDVIAEYGTKIFIKARKGSSKEELNELVQLQFCVMRNLQRGPRAKTASVKVSDLVRMQALAAGSGAPNVPNVPPTAGPGQEAQQAAQGAPQAAPQVPPAPMITSAGDTITNAQVLSFSESKFISDYSRQQMAKNLSSGVPLEYPNPVPRIVNNQTPQTVNHPGRSAGLGRRKVAGFNAGKF